MAQYQITHKNVTTTYNSRSAIGACKQFTGATSKKHTMTNGLTRDGLRVYEESDIDSYNKRVVLEVTSAGSRTSSGFNQSWDRYYIDIKKV